MSANELAIFGGTPVLTEDEHRTWPQIGDEERAAVMRVLDRGVLSGGDAIEARELEARFAEFVGTRHALLTHSGTSALQVAVAAAPIEPGDEVVMPAYSFVATALCVLAQGGIPRFVDVDRESGNLDPDAIERVLSPRTRAIMPVHIHGCPADMDAILTIANRHDLVVIEDAAQAHGATYQGKNVGTLGAMAGFSLQSSKNLSAGEGGVFVTDDDARMERANQARNFGQDLHLKDRAGYDVHHALDGGRPLVSLFPGHMFRGNEMMAAFATAQLAKLPDRTRAAQENAEVLRAAVDALDGVHLQRIPDDRTTAWHKVRVHFDADEAGVDLAPRQLRDALKKALSAEGANAVLWQDHLLPEHPVFARFDGYGHGWPFHLHEDPAALHATYEANNFPRARALLDSSVVLFSQTRPLIAQTREIVERYGEAFRKVWARRDELTKIARDS